MTPSVLLKKVSMKLSGVFRLTCRMIFRSLLRAFPPLRRLAVRMPFSRFHSWVYPLFSGEVAFRWRGVDLKLNPGQIHGYCIYFLGKYSDPEVDKIIQVCPSEGVLADVGANTGYYALAVAKALPGIRVHSFEPVPDLCVQFMENLSRNRGLASRVVLVQKAVSDRNGSVRFLCSSAAYNQETGRIAQKAAGEGVSITVPTTTLDDHFEEVGVVPDLVKIDVEGAELEVLNGMSRMLSKPTRPQLLVEVHPFYYSGDERRLFKERVLAALGPERYDLSMLQGDHWVPLPSPDQWPGRLHALALRRVP